MGEEKSPVCNVDFPFERGKNLVKRKKKWKSIVKNLSKIINR